MKRIFAYIIAAVMLFAASTECFAYTAGEKSIFLDIGDYTKINNCVYKNNSLTLAKGGTAVYDLYIPFNAVKINMFFSASIGDKLMMYIDEDEYELNLEGAEKYIDLHKVVRKGEHRITFVAQNNISIHKFELEKENVDIASAAVAAVPTLTDFEKAIQTAVIINTNSPIITVNGARRYVNNDNFVELPYEKNNDVYLPLHTFSRAFGYYYEKTDDTVILTKEDKTFVLKNGVLTKQLNEGTAKKIENIIISDKENILIPVKYFAQIDGKTVVKRDNFYIVEYPSNAKKIIKDNIFSELCKFYAGLYVDNSEGNTYYVCQSCNANDKNDGSRERPFRTLSKAASVAKAGDTVIIGGGTYHEVLSPLNDGTASKPITFKAAQGEEVEISACSVLGSPSGSEGDMLIYNALTDLGDGRNQIFYKKENLTAGRHPNTHTVDRDVPDIENLSSVWPTQGNIKVTVDNNKLAVSDTDLNQESGYWKGGTLVALIGNGWSLGSAKIEDSEPGELTLGDTTYRWWFASKGDTYDDFAYITDCKNTVDLPGEWAIEDGKIYIIPPTGENSESLRLEQKVRQLAIDIADRKHIVIDGIDTYGGGIKMNNSEMCVLKNGNYRYISHYTYGMDQREGYIDGMDIYNENGAPPRGEMGIYVGGRDNVIINNHIAYSAAAGIYSVGKYEYMENNIISDCGYMGSYVGGLFIGTQGWEEPDTPRGGNAIFSNTVYNSGRYAYGVSSTEAWYTGNTNEGITEAAVPAFLPDEVAYNEFYNGAIASRDVGTVYLHGAVMGTDRLKSKFHNNMVHDSWSFDSFNCGIYYDNWMSGAECYDNLIFYSDERIEPKNAVYIQQKSMFPVSFAQVDEWNNIDAGYISGGKKSITAKNYPNEKPFKTGAEVLQKDKTPLLNSIGNNSWITPEEMTHSNGVEIIDDKLCPSGSGDWICIPNVDFSDGKNQLVIEYTGDKYNTGDIAQIIVGDSVNKYELSVKTQLNATASYLWGTNTKSVFIHDIVGTHNVYVKFNDYKSACIKRLKLTTGYDEYKTNANVFASDAVIEVATGSGSESTGKGGYAVGDDEHWYMKATWNGARLRFDNVYVKADSDMLFIKVGSNNANKGQKIEIVKDSPNGEVIGEYVVTETSWTDFEMKKVPLKTTLKKGKYTLYVKFSGNGTTNFYYFGFGNSAQ